jgi:hypothetical protein
MTVLMYGAPAATPGTFSIMATASGNLKFVLKSLTPTEPLRRKRTRPETTDMRFGPMASACISALRTMMSLTVCTPVKANAPRKTPSMANTVRSLRARSEE